MLHISLGPFSLGPFSLRCWAAALTLIPAMVLPGSSSSQEVPLVVRGGRYLNVETGLLVTNPGIVVYGGRLMSVSGEDVDVDLSDATVLTLDEGETVLPGLFDLHAHYSATLMGGERTEELSGMPIVFLANGVTSTFPAGEYDPEGMMELRKRIDRGEHPGPRIYNTGPYFGGARPGWRKMSKEEVYAEVDYWAERGVRGFKAKRPDPETLKWLIERAHLHGLTVTAHMGSGYRNSVNPRDAILMGIDRVEHFLGGAAFPDDRSAYDALTHFRADSPEFREIVDLYKKHNVVYDATLTAYGYFGARDDEVWEPWHDETRFFTPEVLAYNEEHDPSRFLPQFDTIYRVKCPLVKAFFEAGGTLSLGTDHASTGLYLSGFGAHRELHAMVRCGIPPAAALKIATLNGARALGVGDRLGSLEAGKLADFFVVRGNPLEDIRNTRNVLWVVRSGRLFDAQELLASAEGTIGPGNVTDNTPGPGGGRERPPERP